MHRRRLLAEKKYCWIDLQIPRPDAWNKLGGHSNTGLGMQTLWFISERTKGRSVFHAKSKPAIAPGKRKKEIDIPWTLVNSSSVSFKLNLLMFTRKYLTKLSAVFLFESSQVFLVNIVFLAFVVCFLFFSSVNFGMPCIIQDVLDFK